MTSPTYKTALFDEHVTLDAKMAPFGGFEMPIQYSGIIHEHMAVRTTAGLFDVSHMGEVLVEGPQALDFLQHVVTNDVSALFPGKAQYTVMCHENGGAVDDLLIYQLAEDAYLLVLNASNTKKDLAHLRQYHSAVNFDCELIDQSDETALLAIQGPTSIDIVSKLTDLPLNDLPYYQFVQPEPGSFLGCSNAIIARTGYTGEPGLEIYCENSNAHRVWKALLDAGADDGLIPCGLGARDTLRLEAGYCLYGHELTDDITPLEAGLGWVVKLQKENFVGRDALRTQKEAGIPRKLIGFVIEDRGIPRADYPLVNAEGEIIGEVTSGSQSPILGKGIGLGLVQNDPRYTAVGNEIAVSVRGRNLRSVIRKPPFHLPA